MWIDVLLALLALLFHLGGIFCAIQAILISRTPSASIGWVFALILMPYIAIPLFLVFGESRFTGYPHAGDGTLERLDDALRQARRALEPHRAEVGDAYTDAAALVEALTKLPATRGNHAQLLIDGQQTFDAIAAAIAEAKKFLLIQFFIIHDDELGRAFKSQLLAARARGIDIHVLIDQIGSHSLPTAYREELRAAGVHFRTFVTNRETGRKFRINFRNHRKLVIADGRVAFIGGLNVGDEYMGRYANFGPWRDTFMRLTGPVVLSLQIPYLEDWFFTTREVLDLPWDVHPAESDAPMNIIAIPSGPSRTWNVGPAAYLEIIRSARRRLWLASPYFVPDQSLRAAIAHAAIRGVDVRLILPQMADHTLPWLSSFTFYPSMRAAGVRIYRYQPGFMHQKVLLADDDIAIVGSINLDYRSFMLNFEISAAIESRAFASEVEEMFDRDFANSEPADLYAYENGSLLFRLKCRAAALLSPQQ